VVLVIAARACACATPDAPPAEEAPPVDAPQRSFPVDDAAVPETAPATSVKPACDPSTPFGAAARVGLGEAVDDVSPRLSADERTLFFASERAGGLGAHDLYFATRASRTDTFDAPRALPALATAGDERDPSLSADGSALFFTSGAEVRVARRADAESPFDAPRPIDMRGVTHPFFAAASRQLWLAFGEAGQQDLVTSSEREDGSFSSAEPVPGLPTAGSQLHPVLSVDGLELLFVSAPDGDAGAPAVVHARREAVDAPFGVAVDVEGLPSRAEPGWLSPDACRLYFSAPSAQGGQRVFVASRAR
jgi:hypothetical protein